MDEKVIVGMSGGVDSSVAALQLKQQGFDVSGLFMKNWDEDDGTDECTALADLNDAEKVCEQLGIDLQTVNFAAEYWDDVFENFLTEYRAGRTPNPDILCNKYIKFRAFLDFSIDLGAARIATGHYASIGKKNGLFRLLKGDDPRKDQSYFLYTLDQDQLASSLFPLGSMEKTTVRDIARQAGFVTARKKDSTGICFIGERRFKVFLSRYLPAQPGNMETPEGDTVGKHDGLMYYTIGQRQGLGIGGVKGRPESPWYVLDKDLVKNVLVVDQNHDHGMLFHHKLVASHLHWIAEQPVGALQCQAKTRYRQADQDCVVEVRHTDPNQCRVSFTRPQRAITPGQSVVFYQHNECLGGGIIERAFD